MRKRILASVVSIIYIMIAGISVMPVVAEGPIEGEAISLSSTDETYYDTAADIADYSVAASSGGGSVGGGGEARIIPLPITEDSYSDITAPALDNSNANFLYARYAAGNHRSLYLKTDASSFIGITAISVKLRMFVYEWSAGGIVYSRDTGSLPVYSVDNKEWKEADINHNASESLPTTDLGVTLNYSGGANQWAEVDITDYFNAQEDKIIALKIMGDRNGERFRFVSSNATGFPDAAITPWEAGEDASNYHPYLEIYAVKPPVLVETVDVVPSQIELREYGKSATLEAHIEPSNADVKTVKWESDNPEVATVSSTGVVTPGMPGTARITATAEDAGAVGECIVTVNSPFMPEKGMFMVKKMVSDDAYITDSSGMAGTISGQETVMQTRGVGGNNRWILLRSDMSEYAGCQVVRARLFLTTHSYEDAVEIKENRMVNVRSYDTNDWAERSVNYTQAMDHVGKGMLLGSAVFDTEKIGEEMVVDVTDLYANYLDENLVASFELIANLNTRLYFYSKEGSVNKAPYVELILLPIDVTYDGDAVSAKISGVQESTVLLGLYDQNGTLIDSNYSYRSPEQTEAETMEAKISGLSSLDGIYARAFYWESLETMKPLFASSGINTPSSQSGSGQGNISISGKTVSINGKKTANDSVALQIVKPGKTVSNDANINDVLVHFYQAEADDEGNYSFKFDMPDQAEKGLYEMRIMAGEDEEVTVEQFMYLNSTEQQEESDAIMALGLINSVEDLKAIVEPYSKSFGFGASSVYANLYAGLDKEQRAELLNGVYNNLKTSGITSTNLVSQMEQLLALKSIKWTTNRQAIKSLLQITKNVLGIKAADWDTYMALTDTSAVDRAVAGVTFDTNTAFNTAFVGAFPKASDGGSSGGTIGGGGGSVVTTVSSIGVGAPVPTPIPQDTPEATPEPTEQPTPAPTAQPQEMFNDLGDYAWAKDSIQTLVEKGVISGRGNGQFAPSENVLREEFVKLIVEALGMEDDGTECSFQDVSDDAWFYRYAATAQQQGIVNGAMDDAGDVWFGIGQNITRQDMASMLYRAMQNVISLQDKVTDMPVFADDQEISEYAKEAVAVLQSLNIINGVGDNNFAPLQPATRAQAAVIIQRFILLLDHEMAENMEVTENND